MTTTLADRTGTPQDGPSLTVEMEAGRFVATSTEPIVSSRRKRVFRGELHRAGGGVAPAVAKVFDAEDPSFYGAEVAALSRNSLVNVGPEVFCLAGSVCVAASRHPVVVEEDAGVSLEGALLFGEPVPGVPGVAAAPLASPGTPERALEVEKVWFDVLAQVSALHANGLYHRDVRVANVCVRRFGPRPQDIHASLIDHELVTEYEGDAVPASAERYRRVLFEEIPRAIEPTAGPVAPTSILRDMGYLAALRFELECGRAPAASDAPWFTAGHVGVFSYAADGTPLMRRVDAARDLVPAARRLGLVPADVDHLFDPRLLSFVSRRVAYAGFLDARGLAMVERMRDAGFGMPVERIAREVVYPRWVEQCERMGRVPEYASFDEQPEVLQESNRDQVRDIPSKVRALGYRIVPAAQAPAGRAISAFRPEEIEELARMEHERWAAERLRAGWVAGPERDDARRVHPDLVPYDELSEQVRDYDRDAVRGIVGILAEAGFAVCR